jgi:hypothetical protein
MGTIDFLELGLRIVEHSGTQHRHLRSESGLLHHLLLWRNLGHSQTVFLTNTLENAPACVGIPQPVPAPNASLLRTTSCHRVW